jgi:two-component system response regulator HydG
MSGEFRILVVDDDRRMGRTVVDILEAMGYQAEAAYSGSEAIEKLAKGRFDCALTDIRMPEVNGMELFKAIRAIQSDLPVLFMTAYSSDKLVQEGLEAGAAGVLTKPLDINLLLSLLSHLRKERSVVIVDDDAQFCATLADILQARGYAVTQVTDPCDLVKDLRADGQVVLLDMKLDNIDGLEILKEIRVEHPHLPVILVTGYREKMASAIDAALKINAHTCLYKPLQIEELLEVLAEVQRQELGRLLGPFDRARDRFFD